MADCLFCKIIAGEIPSGKVYEDDMVYAFCDIDPQAPEHILIIPKKHFESILAVSGEDFKYVDCMMQAAQKIAREKGLAEDGFRLVFNTGKSGGQTVPHLHMHLLGGRSMEWPPG
ncbi:histidine triad nucleotide-binding protein [Christensenellaceae bacterium]|nr:histidine triad nucleotide-binding protein [Christensenellaceae bacterium]BDF61208.1 histidine triad nucleotide-binding protein [Christensenellaceae bacterium]